MSTEPKKQNLELTDEEHVAFGRAFDWMAACEKAGTDYRLMDDGYAEACILANLLNKFAFTILRDMKQANA